MMIAKENDEQNHILHMEIFLKTLQVLSLQCFLAQNRLRPVTEESIAHFKWKDQA